MEEYRSKHTGQAVDEAIDNFNATKGVADSADAKASQALEAAAYAMPSAPKVYGEESGTKTFVENASAGMYDRIVYLTDMQCFVAIQGSSYYSNWATRGEYTDAKSYGTHGMLNGKMIGPMPVVGRLYLFGENLMSYNGSAFVEVYALGGIEEALKDKADKSSVTQVANKQLQLSVKDNGNIILSNANGESKEFMPSTPSGDPMHYAYEIAGAVWNNNTGHWEYCGLVDLTTEDVRQSYNKWCRCVFSFANNNDGIRFIFPPYSRSTVYQSSNYFSDMRNLEVIPAPIPNGFWTGSAASSFYNNDKLREIGGVFDNISLYGVAFKGCKSLIEIRIKRLNKPVSFPDSPNISKESVLYAIVNSNATTATTITLHHDAYDRLSSDVDILEALQAKPLITLVDASAT